MSQPEPYYREAGAGPGVVCLHSNASTSAQWRGLIDLLATDHHVLAPDLYGAGKSADWHSDRVIGLGDEVSFIEPVLLKAGKTISLVGHSYGGAVALMAALANPKRFVKRAVLTERAAEEIGAKLLGRVKRFLDEQEEIKATVPELENPPLTIS